MSRISAIETHYHIGGVCPEPPPPPFHRGPMLPVDPAELCILYKGTCGDLEAGGRCAYLRKRWASPVASRWPRPPSVNASYAWPWHLSPSVNDKHFRKALETRRIFFRLSDDHPNIGP
ncbi:Protein of unknown function, partial [Gryllus bimaculatus]